MFWKGNETSSNSTSYFLSEEYCERLRKFFASLESNESNAPSLKKSSNENGDENGEHALYYILVVLIFYSFIIIILMVKYVRKESRDMADCKAYAEFLNKSKIISIQQTKYMCARNFEKMLKNMDLERNTQGDFDKSSKKSVKKAARIEKESNRRAFAMTLESPREQKCEQILADKEIGQTHSSFNQKQNVGSSMSTEEKIKMENLSGKEEKKSVLQSVLVETLCDKRTKSQILEVEIEPNSSKMSLLDSKLEELTEITAV